MKIHTYLTNLEPKTWAWSRKARVQTWSSHRMETERRSRVCAVPFASQITRAFRFWRQNWTWAHGEWPGAQNVTMVQHDRIFNFEYTFLRNGECLYEFRSLVQDGIYSKIWFPLWKMQIGLFLSKLWPKNWTGPKFGPFSDPTPLPRPRIHFSTSFFASASQNTFFKMFYIAVGARVSSRSVNSVFWKTRVPPGPFLNTFVKTKKICFCLCITKIVEKTWFGVIWRGLYCKNLKMTKCMEIHDHTRSSL